MCAKVVDELLSDVEDGTLPLLPASEIDNSVYLKSDIDKFRLWGGLEQNEPSNSNKIPTHVISMIEQTVKSGWHLRRVTMLRFVNQPTQYSIDCCLESEAQEYQAYEEQNLIVENTDDIE